MQRRIFLQAGLAGTTCVATGRGFAQTYPSRPIRMIVPFAVGGPTDVLARRLAELAANEFGQPVVVDNKPGAGGAIGTAEVARAVPDGYTLGMAGPDALISTAVLLKSPGFDARADLSLIMNISAGRQILLVSGKSGISSFDDLLAKGRANPGTISYVSWGVGSRPDLLFKSIEGVTGAVFTSVQYRGLGAALQDLVSNNVQMAIVPVGMSVQYSEKGLARMVAVMGSDRAEELPAVKTTKEMGLDLPIMNALLWSALFGPKGLPPGIVQRWVAVLQKSMQSPGFEQFMKTFRQSVIGHHTEQFTREFAAEHALITDLTRKLGFTAQ